MTLGAADVKMTSETSGGHSDQPTKRQMLWTSLRSCPPLSPFSTVTSLVLLIFLIYGTLWGLMRDPVLPGGPVFGLFAIVIICYLGGQLMKLLKVPTLVACLLILHMDAQIDFRKIFLGLLFTRMMVSGFILRNVPHINVAEDIPEDWAGNIRNMALVLILLRAGLEVDSDVLKSNKATCSKLIFFPFIVESCTGAIASHYLLELPWIWSFLLGFMLAAVSPAVVLPVMLKLQKKGIGTTNGIPTLVIAVAGIDDVVALTGFEVILGITFATGSLGWTIAQGPLEVLVGIIYGVLLGFISWYIPNPEEKSKSVFRFLILCFGGTFVLFGSQALDWGAAGALGCICLPFVAAIRWKTKDWDEEDNPVGQALAFVWRIIEPFLFGLIGSEIRIDYLQPSTIGLGLATLFIALALRMVASLIAAFGAGFTLKEQIFVTFAGLPKATVQAAIGPVALALARKNKLGPEIEQYGIQILTVAVLAILITAPLGATAISLLAPRLLENNASDITNSKSKPTVRKSIVNIFNSNHCSCNSFNQKEDSKSDRSGIESSNNIYTIARL